MQHTECALSVNLLDQRFELEGVTLGAAVQAAPHAASGEPLMVLLHGVTRQWRDYAGVLPALGALGPVTAIEHRGHGASSHGHPRYQVRDFVDDVTAWLTSHTGGPVVLLGHSLGAMTAAMVAARVPGQVKALVLEDPPGSYLGRQIEQSHYWLQFTGLRGLLRQNAWPDAETLGGALADLSVQHPQNGRVVPWSTLRNSQALQFTADCLLRMDVAVLDDLIAGRWLEGLDWFGELRHITCPTLLLRSDPECGGMLSEGEARLIQSRIRICDRMDSPGHEHNLHGTAPARYLDLVRRFLHPHLHSTCPP